VHQLHWLRRLLSLHRPYLLHLLNRPYLLPRLVRASGSSGAFLVVLSVLFYSNLCVPTFSKDAAKSIKEDVTVIQQVNQALGPMTLYISDDAAKLVAEHGQLILITKAPTWKVVALSVPRNKGIAYTLDEWKESRGLGLMGTKDNFSLGVRQVARNPILKFDCVVLRLKGKPEKAFLGAEEPMLFRSVQKKVIDTHCYSFTKAVAFNKEIETFFSGIYNQPNHEGLPLELTTYYTDGSTDRTYYTKSVTKSTINRDFFSYPTGWTKASGLTEVLISKKQQANLNDYFDVLLAPDSSVKK
jgi:hypothetical protein